MLVVLFPLFCFLSFFRPAVLWPSVAPAEDCVVAVVAAMALVALVAAVAAVAAVRWVWMRRWRGDPQGDGDGDMVASDLQHALFVQPGPLIAS